MWNRAREYVLRTPDNEYPALNWSLACFGSVCLVFAWFVGDPRMAVWGAWLATLGAQNLLPERPTRAAVILHVLNLSFFGVVLSMQLVGFAGWCASRLR